MRVGVAEKERRWEEEREDGHYHRRSAKPGQNHFRDDWLVLCVNCPRSRAWPRPGPTRAEGPHGPHARIRRTLRLSFGGLIVRRTDSSIGTNRPICRFCAKTVGHTL